MKPQVALERLSEYLTNECGVCPNDTGIIAVSGGGDSTLLLLLMADVASRLQLELTVVTVNHGLRPEADQEALFVETLAKKHGLGFRSVEVDVARRIEAAGTSLEEAARLERREALESVLEETDSRWIALGHTRTDQAETLLLRLRRGTGLDGLACMKPRVGRLIRPLLWLTREDAREVLERSGQPWVEDPMNKDPRFDRSRVRFEVLPRVSEELAWMISRRAAHLTETLSCSEEAWNQRFCVAKGGTLVIDTEMIRASEHAIASRLIRRGFRDVWSERLPLTRSEAMSITRLSRGPRGKRVDFNGATATTFGGFAAGLLIERHRERALPSQHVITKPGRYRIEGLRLTVVVGGESPVSPIWGRVTPDEIFTVRNRLPGDRLRLNKKKMKRLWQKMGLWSDMRDWIPLIVKDNFVEWTALSPDRQGSGMLVSFKLDEDNPMRQWIRLIREGGWLEKK